MKGEGTPAQFTGRSLAGVDIYPLLRLFMASGRFEAGLPVDFHRPAAGERGQGPVFAEVDVLVVEGMGLGLLQEQIEMEGIAGEHDELLPGAGLILEVFVLFYQLEEVYSDFSGLLQSGYLSPVDVIEEPMDIFSAVLPIGGVEEVGQLPREEVPPDVLLEGI